MRVRYGLPVNFQAMLLQPHKKNMKKLREVLYELYKHLDSSAAIIDVSQKQNSSVLQEHTAITLPVSRFHCRGDGDTG